MLLFRGLFFFLLLLAVVSFVFYVATGQPRYKRFGIVIVKWTVLSAFAFFAVLALERFL
ncbi:MULTISPECIES: hypothetical protein [Comamonadaceae]|uniref:Uncharacterized protein n=1 Tax=Paracidovorax avenae (strain ATCC 19860 / DSM 7227 / CCUG 15838 / JCM 20985 / LMG 2117 / NCPPB 1011) TaxID=643561 RepID=F0Q7Z8_PARA1|nr:MULTISPECIES: hypothetical protein [Comamonadaceae]ADX44682.1 hypothetical protein Acav_0759 [Paracidovorax avenae ATCC 19860]MDA8450139.1 hypothetical protein [Acidovorax sp. GBBC 3297]MDA8459516.1 hypothetical protein [Acidovorax sp. GBBC 3333]MDA8464620.1 hypothetical protein [Acidovorax sp. GBBC 3332]MDA8469586.1 hypothetical protein [Acidovorax sp. GBBC 3299]